MYAKVKTIKRREVNPLREQGAWEVIRASLLLYS